MQIIDPQNPFIFRDFRQGRYIPYSVASSLVPMNSVAHSQNVNFDTIVGSAVVRAGTTKLGATISSGHTCLGLADFNLPAADKMTAVFAGASTASVYYYNNGWTVSSLTGINNTFKVRFATFGGGQFLTSKENGMYFSTDGITWANGASNNCLLSADVRPQLLYRYTGRLLASGDPTYPDRVFFSSIISPAASPFITWNDNATTGDWIDINPDDGGNVTAFSETSTFLIVFKSNGMYRMDTVSKTVDPENIYNVGAVSQEAVTLCQGITYFYSGQDIRRTNGGFPEQISRAGVQDILDAISVGNQTEVYAGTDGQNVFFSVGNVTLNTNKDNQFTINNCVLKFSPRDQSWSVHSYADSLKFFAPYTDSSNGRKLRAGSASGYVLTMDLGNDDLGTPINYVLETQDIEFGSRSRLKNISDKIVVYTNNGIDGQVQFRLDGSKLKDVPMSVAKRVNIGTDVNLQANFFNFRWFGLSTGTAPVLEGFELHDVTDLGVNTSDTYGG